MPFDFAAREERLISLLGDAQPRGQSRESDFFLDSCIGAGHRKHFFVPMGKGLHRRGQTIFEKIESTPGLVSQSAKPGKPHWQAFCEGRPLSLRAILCIDDALQAIANHTDASVRLTTAMAGSPLTLTKGSVIASIYYVKPDEFANARERHGIAREKLSMQIFKLRDTLTLIERGENDKHVRLTRATIDQICDFMGDDVRSYFTHRVDAGPRNGENTFALELTRGNMCFYQGSISSARRAS